MHFICVSLYDKVFPKCSNGFLASKVDQTNILASKFFKCFSMHFKSWSSYFYSWLSRTTHPPIFDHHPPVKARNDFWQN